MILQTDLVKAEAWSIETPNNFEGGIISAVHMRMTPTATGKDVLANNNRMGRGHLSLKVALEEGGCSLLVAGEGGRFIARGWWGRWGWLIPCTEGDSRTVCSFRHLLSELATVTSSGRDSSGRDSSANEESLR